MGTNFIYKIAKTRWGSVIVSLIKRNTRMNTIRAYLKESMPYEPSEKQIRWCYHDFLRFQWKYKGSLEVDYLGTQLFRKSDFVRDESFATYIRFPWRESVQKNEDRPVFQDKRLFYLAFSEQLGRAWMTADENTEWSIYADFIRRCGGVLVAKLPCGYGGKDVSFVRLQSEAQARELFAQCKTTPMVLEEQLHQCEEIRSFTNVSINTVRMITIIDEWGKPHVARAVLRMGRGNAGVDNYSSGGMVAQIDVETGIVFTPAIDKKGHEYLIHPDTAKQIVGFKIPDWERYKAFAIQLAYRYPGMRYVGWDIIKDANGNFCVIEGNAEAGADLMESQLLYGLLPLYDSVLKTGGDYDDRR